MSQVNNNDQSDRYNVLLTIRHYSEEQYDRLLVYLNSGALVLTIGFVQNIIKITEKTVIVLLIASWCLFVLSLLMILISHRSSIAAIDCEIKEKDERSENWNKCTRVLNIISAFFLIAGLILFIIFIAGEL
jgi:predicted tellurium resistance membrane protein TerC